MAAERTWSILAFRKGDDTCEDHRRGVPEWRLAQAVNWAVFRGFDTVLIELTNEPASSSRWKTHHVCRDGYRCPGGC
jgi:hypothetical protein